MKRLLCLLGLVACMLLCGCVKYRITLHSGESFTVLGKPHYDAAKQVYTFKLNGKKESVYQSRVASIEPASEASSKTFVPAVH